MLTDQVLPRIIILATGGTIAGVQTHESVYTAGQLTVESLSSTLSDVGRIAQLKTAQIANIGSQSMTWEVWSRLLDRIHSIKKNNQADSVIITHGTDTLEETAYFLQLASDTDLSVVLTGAMRPANAYGADGPRNLQDAVQWAVFSRTMSLGVTIVMNGLVHSARYLQKQACEGLDAFISRQAGPVARISHGEVCLYHNGLNQKFNKTSELTIKNTPDALVASHLPRVSVFYATALADDELLEAMLKTRPRGIIVAGAGNGNMATTTVSLLQKARYQGVIVVRASRCGFGYVSRNLEVPDDQYGFIVANDLNPQKARVLLMLALLKTNDPTRIQEYFNEH